MGRDLFPPSLDRELWLGGQCFYQSDQLQGLVSAVEDFADRLLPAEGIQRVDRFGGGDKKADRFGGDRFGGDTSGDQKDSISGEAVLGGTVGGIVGGIIGSLAKSSTAETKHCE